MGASRRTHGFDAYQIVEGADVGFTCNVDIASNSLRAVRWAGCASIRWQSEIVRLLVLMEFLPQWWIPTATFDDGDGTTEDPPYPDGPGNSARLAQPFALTLS